MHQLRRLIPFIIILPQQFNSQDDQTKDKDQQADPVDPMHYADPSALRPSRILFFQVEIFSDLIPDSHIGLFPQR